MPAKTRTSRRIVVLRFRKALALVAQGHSATEASRRANLNEKTFRNRYLRARQEWLSGVAS